MPESTPDLLHLPALDVPVQIDRSGGGSIVIADAEIQFAHDPDRIGAKVPRQVRWFVEHGLLADEMVILFAKPLEWTSELGKPPERLPQIPEALGCTYVLCCSRNEVYSGMPELPESRFDSVYGWSYGAVLVRGKDRPLITEAQLRIRVVG